MPTPEFILLSNRGGDVRILNGQTISEDIFRAAGYGGFIAMIPAAFTGTALSFQVADEENGTFQPLRDTNNVVVTQPVTQGNSYQLRPELTGARFFKLVSNAAEGADRTIRVLAIAGSPGGGSGIVTVGTGATDLGKAEDAPHTSGDVGVMALAVRNSAGANLTDTDGDYTPIATDAAGRVQIGAIIPGSSASNLGKAEDGAHTSGDVGVMALAVRQDTLAVLAANNDYLPLVVDATGRLWANTELPDAALLTGSGLTNVAAPQVAALIAGVAGASIFPLSAVVPGQLDGISAASFGLETTAWSYLSNGTSGDRERGNTNTTVLASAARTATPAKVDQTNYNAMSLVLVIDVTAVAATPSVVFTIQGKDPLSGKYYTILASAAITGVGTTVLRVDPNGTAAANLVAHDVVPRTWAVDAVHADADSITYSVGALLVRG